MAEIENDVFYAHLDQPVEIRKHILESSRQIVQLLQRYESVRDIRVQKSAQVVKLRKNFRELTVLINKLKQEMPKVNARVKIRQEASPVVKTKTASGKKTRAVNAPAIQKLEEELKMIESKLNRIS
jgi:uncharacterized coiled-coil DUF342 family protein